MQNNYQCHLLSRPRCLLVLLLPDCEVWGARFGVGHSMLAPGPGWTCSDASAAVAGIGMAPWRSLQTTVVGETLFRSAKAALSGDHQQQTLQRKEFTPATSHPKTLAGQKSALFRVSLMATIRKQTKR